MKSVLKRDNKSLEIDQMRPVDGHQRACELRERCGISFYQMYHKDFVEIPCPACGSNEWDFAFTKYGFKHNKCSKCKTLFCSPRPTEELLVEYYANFEAPEYWSELLLKTDTSRKLLQHRPRVEKIVALLKEKFAKREVAAVDLGAGTGAFALALRDSGFFRKVIAVDFSKECVQACAKRGLEAHQGTVDDVIEDSIGLLTMNDLIEHLSEPLLFLKKCYSIIAPKGMIAIATPNGEGFDFQLMKEKTVNITPPEHLNYFNPYSIKELMRNAGFHVIKVETPGILDTQIVMREVEKGNIDLGKDNKFLQYLLYQTSADVVSTFQKFLQENLLSSHMLLLAEKR